MSLDFFCDIQMVGPEFGVTSMKADVRPALDQHFCFSGWRRRDPASDLVFVAVFGWVG